MGNRSPSRIRREGRNAFSPGEDPNDVNPYLHRFKSQFWAGINAGHWEEGWREAEEEYNRKENEKMDQMTLSMLAAKGELDPDTEIFEVFWDDLTEEAQKRFRETMTVDPDDSNWDVYPMVILEIQKDKP